MKTQHSNISVFVPHIGSPNMSSFCNQRHITGMHRAVGPKDIIDAVNVAKESKNFCSDTTEIAFFGGSFTAINHNYMLALLETAAEFVEEGVVSGIRISTRPDAIDDEILELLKKYYVTAIELGAQSLNDRVLKSNNRGHTASQVVSSSNLIKAHGFSLGLQMMTGLFRDTDALAIKTAKQIIDLKPDTVRIYPTIVLKDTDLAALYNDGIYKPQELDKAVSLCAELYEMFENSGIKVIRLGLHSIEQDSYIAGPWHPAFSELCQSEIFYKKISNALTEKGNYIIYVAQNCLSKAIGQKKNNIIKLKNDGYNCVIKPDNNLIGFEIKVERGE